GALDEHYYGDVMRKIGGKIRDDWPPEIARLADLSMAAFLRQRGASESAIGYLVLGFADDAALDFMRDAENHRDLSRVKGGTAPLPRALAARLADRIHYGCAVERIDRDDARVRIGYRRVGLERLGADAVVCT